MFSTRPVRRNISKLMKKFSASGSNNKSYKKLVNIDEKDSEKLRVPRGCVAMYVGEERKRYQVPVNYLSLPKFQQLIESSLHGDAFDVKVDGPITLACPTQTFDQLLKIAKKKT
ncbi:hypothetical protein ACOSP7_000411 [Xanthoceras sorbifolium]|uniref:Uncharacterized protein n=1 Tax=Xanthoceras sorbifolium TaxID=99658 RepID=A0ABQ8IPN5_9ROSI|nr:hypothetical protein JRO89_XS01G0371300 [Xanthoceras sorbifolium]KAH7578349.1 hypothetical protein JRO89_XS01G0371400 [Xanthoceras sorbifolium]